MSDNELAPTPHDVEFTLATPDGQPDQGGVRLVLLTLR